MEDIDRLNFPGLFTTGLGKTCGFVLRLSEVWADLLPLGASKPFRSRAMRELLRWHYVYVCEASVFQVAR